MCMLFTKPSLPDQPPPLQGKFTIIKDCAKIEDGTIIPPNTVVPALALFAGSPGSGFAFTCVTTKTNYR